MAIVREIALSTVISIILSCFALPGMANAEQVTNPTHQTVMEKSKFIRKSKSILGDITVEDRGGQKVIVFSDDFKAKSGPDLKVFLSPHSVSSASGKNALSGAVRLGELKRTKGGQEYLIPQGVDLAGYS
ncbi:MAG: DM13 domain-containing protein [Pseudomonadota bacterium]